MLIWRVYRESTLFIVDGSVGTHRYLDLLHFPFPLPFCQQVFNFMIFEATTYFLLMCIFLYESGVVQTLVVHI